MSMFLVGNKQYKGGTMDLNGGRQGAWFTYKKLIAL